MGLSYLTLVIIICHTYTLHGRVIAHMYRLPNRTHNSIIFILGGIIEARLDRRHILLMIDHNNKVIKTIIRIKLYIPNSTVAENYRYLLYKYNFSHFDFYVDIGIILNKIEISTIDDPITHTHDFGFRHSES